MVFGRSAPNGPPLGRGWESPRRSSAGLAALSAEHSQGCLKRPRDPRSLTQIQAAVIIQIVGRGSGGWGLNYPSLWLLSSASAHPGSQLLQLEASALLPPAEPPGSAAHTSRCRENVYSTWSAPAGLGDRRKFPARTTVDTRSCAAVGASLPSHRPQQGRTRGLLRSLLSRGSQLTAP